MQLYCSQDNSGHNKEAGSRVFFSNRLSQTKTKRKFNCQLMQTSRSSRSPSGQWLLLSVRQHTAAAAVTKQNNGRIEISVVVDCTECSACMSRTGLAWPGLKVQAGAMIFRNVGHHLPSTSAHFSGHRRHPACSKQQDGTRCDVTTPQQFVSRFHVFLALTLGKERG